MYSGIPYRQFVQERIFDPLGMMSTTYSTEKARASGNFSQQWSFESGGRLIPYWIHNENMEDFIAGAGGIISSSVDMVRLACAGIDLSPDLFRRLNGSRCFSTAASIQGRTSP